MNNIAVHMISFILLLIGGLNWLLVAFGWTLVEALFGVGNITKVIYILVGLAALCELFTHKKGCLHCTTKDVAPEPAPEKDTGTEM